MVCVRNSQPVLSMVVMYVEVERVGHWPVFVLGRPPPLGWGVSMTNFAATWTVRYVTSLEHEYFTTQAAMAITHSFNKY